MALTIRETGLASPSDKDHADFTIYSGAWPVGLIYKERGGPELLRWFWSLHGMFGKPPDIESEGRAATIEEAKAQFDTTWRQWLAWAKLGELQDVRAMGR